ncbi:MULTISPECIES: RNA-binding S4 domain-containing protein [unclassified Lactobacillus]|uniref:RNA-binding S4 domain-containing protein n=1 Tax=unclassified Lactobacillus TaxID=2620435 RepID=UPI0018DE3F8C|nr:MULTISPECIES: RNA-binding S4 domain-containing protein [unclassified Lactobacillus]MCT6807043.1 RNA-binding S4 domain-containing protein [Bombilactobacillus sp.]MCT6847333.1 RNA-binding S4 domain-containing protein [Lactobacillus helsingborgensis]MCT6902370.1 RNA-binding S4 domain-containing protein [Lactobacillus sp.]MBH9989726.1 RNA-binding S4 domain-containing protein [Lactobacillus sp. M0392]MBI0024229.1 RNA-binding S4 domain-containing protein [Lactobacillus sp. W8171]
MRIDKFLKVSRLVKRRPIAKEMADQGRIKVNDHVVKSSYGVKIGDIIEVGYGSKQVKAKVCAIKETTKKAEASELYELIN